MDNKNKHKRKRPNASTATQLEYKGLDKQIKNPNPWKNPDPWKKTNPKCTNGCPGATLGLPGGCLGPTLGYSGHTLDLPWAYVGATLTYIAAALGLGMDLRNGNLNISLVLLVFLKRCVFFTCFLHLLMWFVLGRVRTTNWKIIVILGGEKVLIIFGFNRFFWNACFLQVSLFMISLKIRRVKSIHGRIPWAQNSGNPCTKLIISLFCSYMCVFRFLKKYETWWFSRSIWRYCTS